MEKVLKLFGWLLLVCLAACTTDDELLDTGKENLMQVPQLSRAALAPSATIVGYSSSSVRQFSWNLYDPQPEAEDNYWESSEASPSLDGVSKIACLVPQTEVNAQTITVKPAATDVLQWGAVSVADKAADGRFYINLESKLATICVMVKSKINGLTAHYAKKATFDVTTGEYTWVDSPAYYPIGSNLKKDGEYYAYTFSVVPQKFEKGATLLRYYSTSGYIEKTHRFKADQAYDLKAGQTLHLHAYGDGWTVTRYDTFVPVDDVQITQDDFELTLRGENQKQLTATVSPSSASEPELTWSSSDESVATVDANGNVTAKKRGTATITATSKNGKTDTVVVTVKDPATTATFTPSVLELKVGETRQVTVTFDTSDKAASWTSSNPAVVTVDETTGKATAVSSGVTTITVTTIDGKTFSLQVIVASHLGDWGEGGNGTGTLQPE